MNFQIEILALETKKQANKQKNNTQTKKDVKFNIGARDNGLFHLFGKYACVNSTYFVLVCISTYRMERIETLIMVLNLVIGISVGAQAQLKNLHRNKTLLNVPHGGNK